MLYLALGLLCRLKLVHAAAVAATQACDSLVLHKRITVHAVQAVAWASVCVSVLWHDNMAVDMVQTSPYKAFVCQHSP